MGDLIKFPKAYDGPPRSPEDIAKDKAFAKERWIVDSSVEMTFGLVKELEQYGIDLHNDPYIKYDLLMLNEALKALLYRSLRIQHPFQRLSQDIIKEKDADAFFIGITSD
jgi:hypothetical protein